MEIVVEINQKIIPTLQAAEVSPEDILIVKEQLFKVVFFKIMAKAVGVFSSKEAKELNDKIKDTASSEERLLIFWETAKNFEAIVQIADEFMRRDFTDVVENITDLFLKNATAQQKEKFGQLSS